MFIQNFYKKRIVLFIAVLSLFSCNKFVEIPEPKNTLTTAKVFNNDNQATSAMIGVLTQMINTGAATSSFSSGLSTLAGGYSSDEFIITGDNTNSFFQFNANTLDPNNSYLTALWGSAYAAIYGSNAVVEGIAASTSPALHQNVRVQLTAEAKFTRAFSYFYLVNFFGDVPLVLTTDFNKTANMSRTPGTAVYDQIIKDLTDAARDLPADYAISNNERIRPNKWAAKALMARVYLFTGDHNKAVIEANDVIAQSTLYRLETTDLNNVFLKNSSESIWQLQQNTSVGFLGNATPEGYAVLPNPLHTGAPKLGISNALLTAFEPGDLRKMAWIDVTQFTANGSTTITSFPFKYKTGRYNAVDGGIATEYTMVLRLAELYLIRAEANALNGQNDLAIDDLNVLRKRAGLGLLPKPMTKDQTLAAVAKERQTELFAEWGHRWLDLKRTGKAEQVLMGLSHKQPWKGNYQLLYPLPNSEILRDHFLIQNPGY